MSLKFLDEYRDIEKCGQMAVAIEAISTDEINVMEVCGGHTMAIRKNGLHKIVGDKVRFLSGPGCPVCVTAIRDIDKVIEISKKDDTVTCTFGDLFNVPGTESSLREIKADGADVRVVYTVSDVLAMAKKAPERQFVFASIGFETTTPTIAAAVLQARAEKLKNFSIIAMNKTMPQALRAVLGNKNSSVDALICPGHVTAITGMGIYDFIPEEFNVPCCVSGFEPMDILKSVYLIVDMHNKREARVINAYERAVAAEGNVKARDMMYQAFNTCDAEWRGFGVIPGSGLCLRDEYSIFDAEKKFDIQVSPSRTDKGCICADILIGAKVPKDCGLFGGACTPESPHGACMVSSEGACAAWYKYGE